MASHAVPRPPTRASAVVAALLVGAFVQTAAQEVVPAVVLGARIRIMGAGARPIVGKLVSLQGDTVVLLQDGAAVPTAHSRRDATRLQVSRGKQGNAKSGAAIGTGVGALVGLVVGNAAADRCRSEGGLFSGLCGIDLWGGMAGGLLIGGLAGGLVGSLISLERWQTVQPLARIHARASPGHAGLVLSVGF